MYSQLKLTRTYIGGSKKEQFRIYMECQGANKDGKTYDKKGNIYDKDGKNLTEEDFNNLNNPDFIPISDTDDFEFRRLIILEFEDKLHVVFSRKYVSEKIAYLFAFLSIIAMFIAITTFFITFVLSLLFWCVSKYFEHKQYEYMSGYEVGIALLDYGIKEKFGLDMPEISD